MKRFILFLSALVTSVLLNARAFAFIWPDFTPVIPCAPQFCAQCIAADIPLVLSYVEQAKAMKDRYMSYLDTTYWKQKLEAYVMKLGDMALSAAINKIANVDRPLAYSRLIAKCKVANMKNESEVREAFIKLFLQYPTTKPAKMAEYEAIGRQFQMDSTIEAIVTGRELSHEIDTMKQELTKVENCLMKGEKCAEAGMQDCTSADDEENTCMWNNATRAAMLYDKIMRFNEYVVAIMSQYVSVQGINTLARIRRKQGGKKKGAFLLEQPQILKQQKYYASSTVEIGFAAQDIEVEDEMREYMDSLDNKQNKMIGNFVKIKPAKGFETGLDNKDEDLEGQDALTAVQENIDEAKSMHNMKQGLKGYRRIFESYHNMEDYYSKALGNFYDSSMCAINMLDAYYKDGSKAWFGRNCKKHSKGYVVCQYGADEASNSENELNQYDIPCPDNAKKTCFVTSVDKFGERKGISGYLLDLYDKAKEDDAALESESSIVVSNETEEDNAYVTKMNIELQTSDPKVKSIKNDSTIYVTEKDGDGDGSVTPINKLKKQVGGKDQNDAIEKSELKDPALEEVLTAENRKDELLPWTFGAAVMEAVEKDVHSKAGKWGQVKGNFPLWNDQIKFYGQYINGKYDNIRKFIVQEPFADATLALASKINTIMKIAEELIEATLKPEEVLRQGFAKEIEDAKEYYAKLPDPDAKIKEVLQKQDSTLDGKIAEFKAKVAQLNKKKEALFAELKATNEALSDARDEYNKANDDISSSEVTTGRATEATDYGKQLYKGRNLTSQSPQDQVFDNRKSRNAVIEAAAKITKQQALLNVNTLEAKVKRLKDEIEKNQNALEAARSDYVKDFSNTEINARKELLGQTKELESSNSSALGYMKDLAGKNPAVALATEVVDCVRLYALEEVTKMNEKITAMAENKSLYYYDNAPELQSAHEQMINVISDITAEKLDAKCELTSKFGEVIEELNLEELLEPVYGIFKNVCDSTNCKEPDNEYFVSVFAKARDFKSPKGAVKFASAPVREVFHFDVIDYDKIDKHIDDTRSMWSNKNVTITAQSFLDSGLDIPEIWKYILARRSYVEKSIDLAELFSTKNPNKAVSPTPPSVASREFIRGGTYPCLLNGKYIDVINTGDSFRYVTSSSLPQIDGKSRIITDCHEVVAKKNRPVDAKSLGSPGYVNNSNVDNGTESVSELSMILAYVPNVTERQAQLSQMFGSTGITTTDMKLTFNQSVQIAMQIINDNTELGDNPSQDALFYMSQRAFLDRNQFGDFLNQYEILAVTRKAMEELEVQMDEVRESVLFAIEDTGYTVKEDFDLSVDEDFNLISKILKEQKTTFWNVANQDLNKIKAKTSGLKEKIKKARHMLDVMKEDKNEVMAISGNEDLGELRENIKNRETDDSVADEYGNAEKESTTELKELKPPFCASYSFN